MPHIKKNDKVEVLSGKERGKQGKVLKVFLEKQTALVERINFVKRHTKGGGRGAAGGGIVEKEAPLNISKLMVVCPQCSKPARTARKILDDGSKVRVCKKCRQQVDS
jgi:large subunit ribosomal protein L24